MLIYKYTFCLSDLDPVLSRHYIHETPPHHVCGKSKTWKRQVIWKQRTKSTQYIIAINIHAGEYNMTRLHGYWLYFSTIKLGLEPLDSLLSFQNGHLRNNIENLQGYSLCRNLDELWRRSNPKENQIEIVKTVRRPLPCLISGVLGKSSPYISWYIYKNEYCLLICILLFLLFLICLLVTITSR